MVAYVDEDGVVQLEPLVEGIVDDLAEPPVCSWCTVEVSRTRFEGGLTWVHRRTGLLVCSGQVIGGWGALREATPMQWRVAVRPRRVRRTRLPLMLASTETQCQSMPDASPACQPP